MLFDRELLRQRNIGIIAHIDAGKTTCTERILFFTGRIRRTGEVHDGDTEMDFLPQEREMGITISSAATTVGWTPQRGLFAGEPHRVHLIDTPGHVDFTIEVERSLRVLDGAVAVFDAVSGVEPQSETVWRQADRHRVPRIAFINKMDRPGASFAGAVASIRERLGVVAVPVQLPLGEEGAHRGVIDLVRSEAIVFDADSERGSYSVAPIPAEHARSAAAAREALVEACAELDDGILAKFIEGRAAEVTADAIEAALRRATLDLRAVPVLCGSAKNKKGIQMLLDAVITYLPSPADVPPVRAAPAGGGDEITCPPSDEAPLAALAFKVMSLERLGTVTFVRVYSGRLRSGLTVRNATTGKSERVGRLVLLHADKAVDLPSAGPGAIAAIIGLRHTRTGDTLSDPRRPLVLAGLTVPEPVVELVIEPKSAPDQERLSGALARLALEDPSFRVGVDPETGQTLLRGMGELHLAILVDRLQREHRVEATTGRPSVAYRESVAGRATAEHRLVKQSGGPGQFAHVVLEVASAEPGRGLVFESHLRAGAIPKEFVPAIEQGVRGAMSRGIVAGYPVVDVTVRLLDGGHHAVDSKPAAFEVAASIAFRQAAEAADPYLLEPIMAVELTTPEEFLGEVLGDVNGRRGEVRGVTRRGNAHVVSAWIPLRALFGHTSDLRSRTQGRASATMQLSHYARMPEVAEGEVRGRKAGRAA